MTKKKRRKKKTKPEKVPEQGSFYMDEINFQIRLDNGMTFSTGAGERIMFKDPIFDHVNVSVIKDGTPIKYKGKEFHSVNLIEWLEIFTWFILGCENEGEI